MFQFDSQFLPDTLDSLVADVAEQRAAANPIKAALPAPPMVVANENKSGGSGPCPAEDRIAWEDDDTYFVLQD